jgi:hypothetical protein
VAQGGGSVPATSRLQIVAAGVQLASRKLLAGSIFFCSGCAPSDEPAATMAAGSEQRGRGTGRLQGVRARVVDL